MAMSDWDRKRTMDAMFAHVPAQYRAQFLERVKKEQDDMDKKDKKKNVTVAAKSTFLKGKGDKKTNGDDKDSSKKKVSEVTSAQLGMVSPRPMLVGTTPGTEVVPPASVSGKTPADSSDGHTHTANYDEFGNGETSNDNGHSHPIRGFLVGDYQTPDGISGSSHPGQLEIPARTPGAEYKDYKGIM